jgi:hypothetical protein
VCVLVCLQTHNDTLHLSLTHFWLMLLVCEWQAGKWQ